MDSYHHAFDKCVEDKLSVVDAAKEAAQAANEAVSAYRQFYEAGAERDGAD